MYIGAFKYLQSKHVITAVCILSAAITSCDIQYITNGALHNNLLTQLLTSITLGGTMSKSINLTTDVAFHPYIAFGILSLTSVNIFRKIYRYLFPHRYGYILYINADDNFSSDIVYCKITKCYGPEYKLSDVTSDSVKQIILNNSNRIDNNIVDNVDNISKCIDDVKDKYTLSGVFIHGDTSGYVLFKEDK